eukprot:1173348-Amphidinium_carterae.1
MSIFAEPIATIQLYGCGNKDKQEVRVLLAMQHAHNVVVGKRLELKELPWVFGGCGQLPMRCKVILSCGSCK